MKAQTLSGAKGFQPFALKTDFTESASLVEYDKSHTGDPHLIKTVSKQAGKDSIAAKLEGRSRVVIEAVHPEIDGGEYAIQRVVGETVAVEADIFADGHDVVVARLLYRGPGERNWRAIS